MVKEAKEAKKVEKGGLRERYLPVLASVSLLQLLWLFQTVTLRGFSQRSRGSVTYLLERLLGQVVHGILVITWPYLYQ